MNQEAVPWNCDRQGHYWNSHLMQASRVVECDWCIFCSVTRPGFKDPRKKWKNT